MSACLLIDNRLQLFATADQLFVQSLKLFFLTFQLPNLTVQGMQISLFFDAKSINLPAHDRPG
jgi:hypothetical protein